MKVLKKVERKAKKIGIKKGSQAKSTEIVKNMLKEKYSVEQIMKITGVAKEEIKKIKGKM